MSPQADYVVANGTGAAVRSDINGQLAAIVSNNSGATAPSTTYAYQWWADTTTGLLKLRNAANNAWITLFQLDGEWSTLAVENGSAAAPSIYFKDSGTDTGIYSPGTDQVAISTGGTGRLFVNASGNVGLGTSSPGGLLHLGNGTGSPDIILDKAEAGAGTLKFWKAGSASAYIQYDAGEDLVYYSPSGAGGQVFYTGGNARVTINSSGNVGIGSTAPNRVLDVKAASGNGIALTPTAGNATNWIDWFDTGGGPYGRIGYDHQASAMLFHTNNSEKARLDLNGRLLVGTSTTSAISRVVIQGSSSDSTGDALLRLARGSSTVTDGDNLGQLIYTDSNHSGIAARIVAARDGGTWTSGSSMPGRLVFSTTDDGASSPTERMRISAGGTVSTYAANDAIYARSNRTAGNIYATFVGVRDATSVTTGTITFLVYTSGDVRNTNNSYGAISDIKLKENIVDAGSQWNDLKALQVRKYNFKEGQTHTQIGLIAQEVELVSPGLVTESPDRDQDGEDLGTTTKSVNYSVLYMKAVKALQEAMERIETLEAKVAVLEAV